MYCLKIGRPKFIILEDSDTSIHNKIIFGLIVHAISSMFFGFEEMDIFSRKSLILVKRLVNSNCLFILKSFCFCSPLIQQ